MNCKTLLLCGGIAFAMFLPLTEASAQTAAKADSAKSVAVTDTLKYKNAREFRLLGKGFQDTEDYYDRLPASFKEKAREAHWNLAKHSSGMAVRFRSDSRVIAVRYEVRTDFTMNHMAPTGIKGVDLYALEENGKWGYVMTARPKGKTNDLVLVNNMEPRMREYMLYLPLYDGVKELEIGVNKASVLEDGAVDNPERGKPVVIYGTSITQGGCASRPGMVYSSILSRMTGKECINLGFSGNGRMDMEMAEEMCKIDAACYIIDPIPNCTLAEVEERGLKFIEYIRTHRPGVPVIMIEGPYFPQQKYDCSLGNYLPTKHAAYHRAYEAEFQRNPEGFYYIKGDTLSGADREGTVDGIHLTDLGFQRYAENILPVVRKALGMD